MLAITLIFIVSAAIGYAKPVSQVIGSETMNSLTVRDIQHRQYGDSETLQDCLASKNVPVYFPLSPEFSQLAEPYNLRLVYTPAVIVLPTTEQQVSDAVICAGKYNVKVQAKSGGRK